MQYGLTGKVALVTAASKGLGFASAMALAREGCDLAICARTPESILPAAAQIREATGRKVLAIAADVSKADGVAAVLQATFAEFGGVDILISNTGGPPAGKFMDFGDEAWQGAFENLVMSAVRLTRGVIPSMQARGGGRIIYITSGAVKQPMSALVLSNSLRAAVTGMAKTVSAQVAADKITVNCVAPGRIETERLQYLDNAVAANTGRDAATVKAGWVAQIPTGRYGNPEEFGNAVLFLASEGASFITGVTLGVDGGQVNTLV